VKASHIREKWMRHVQGRVVYRRKKGTKEGYEKKRGLSIADSGSNLGSQLLGLGEALRGAGNKGSRRGGGGQKTGK